MSVGKARFISAAEEVLASQIEEHGLDGWMRELKFHPDRRWRFDFANQALMMAVEINGGTWSPRKMRHNYGEGYRNDLEKMNEAQLMGWIVLQFTTDQVYDNTAITDLARAVYIRKGGNYVYPVRSENPYTD